MQLAKNNTLNKTLKTPVLLLIFNRPDLTLEVFNQIKKIKPNKLYIAADGARKNVITDKLKCEETRQIVNLIDWNCEIKTLFRDENLGCKKAVSSAITWFFKQEEQGIILEDDCVPSPSFFFFCQELLDKYKDDTRIMQINGTNLLEKVKIKESYFFSNYFLPWGWATWRRAWEKYDIEMEGLTNFKESGKIKKFVTSIKEEVHWISIFEHTKRENRDTWDHQWHFTCWNNEGICITPKLNLISNIGFRDDATHTRKKNKNISDLSTFDYLELVPSSKNSIHTKFDSLVFTLLAINGKTANKSVLKYAKNIIKKLFS